jgi:ABC-type siderophore export system fused ATPase/permease subunit
VKAAQQRNERAGYARAALSSYWPWLTFLVMIAAVSIGPLGQQRQNWLIVITLMTASVGPMNKIYGGLPAIDRAAATILRLRALIGRLPNRPGAVRKADFPTSFETIELQGVCYEYRDAMGRVQGRLGPIDFLLRRGEIVLVVGGNGSGKSTLMRLLSGLYVPSAGRILLDEAEVDPSTLRHLFGGVMSDFHLFERLYGLDAADIDHMGELLARYELAHVVSVVDASFASTALSSGQRKRLAMIVADLERRPIRIYDEWTADQDPGFRELFYRVLLPEQRRHGCTVVAISHDDRWFHLADRVIRLAEGRVVNSVVTDVSA